jgi:hypothetical protein
MRLWTEQHIERLDRSFAQFLREGKATRVTGLFSVGQ